MFADRNAEDEEATRIMNELSSQELLVESTPCRPLIERADNDDDGYEDMLTDRKEEDKENATDVEADGSDPTEFDSALTHDTFGTWRIKEA